ncbi:MAG TPA: DUF255 domain-containing protein [Longimicrobiales bacterium]
MSDNMRFSPRTNRAHEIQWRAWGAPAFAEAVAANKPVLLNLTAVWCHWCHLMDETTYSDPDLITLINSQLIPVRVDADKHPHVQDRYIAGGWPTNAFLTPTGEVLWSGTYVPEDQFRTVADSVLSAWRDRHAELQLEIERRRKALEAARGRHHVMGLVRREAADDVLAATIDSYDSRNGGFGTEPKFAYVDAVELLYTQAHRGDKDLLRMADHTLDGMVAGELRDADGGFFRYAIKEDWTEPRREKLLAMNAGMLRIYALGAQLRDRADWRGVAEGLVDWANRHLRRADGLWAGSQPIDAGMVDDVLYTSYNALWIGALADAGARLGYDEWITDAARAFQQLLTTTRADNGLLVHYRLADGSTNDACLLVDVVEVCRACISLAQATGDNAYLEQARAFIAAAEKLLWAEDGGFWDHAHSKADVAALRYRDKPFDANAEFARVLNDMAVLTGDRSLRALTERILALLSPQAGRYGMGAAEYALAADEFFEAPPRIIVVGNGADAAELRRTALRMKVPQRRVLTLPEGGRIAQFNFPLATQPVAYVVSAHGASSAIPAPAMLQEALAVNK